MRYLIVDSNAPEQHERARRVFARSARGPWRTCTITRSDGAQMLVHHEAPDAPAVAPRVPFHDTDELLVFYDGLPLHSQLDAHDARTLVDTDRWPEMIGRYTLVRADKRTGTIDIAVDPIGGCQVYRGELGDGWLLTNVPALAHRIADRGELDMHGAAGMLCIHTPLGQHTLVSSIDIFPHGARATIADGQKPAPRADDPLVSAGRHAFDLTPDEAAKAFCDTYAPILSRLEDAGFDLRCALTGGRDSRALAALYAHACEEARFYFGGAVGAAESVIAEQAARALDGSFTLLSDPFNPDAETYDACERSHMERYCGLIDFSFLRPAPDAAPDPNDHREVHLIGQGGEIARWAFESMLALLCTPSVRQTSRILHARLIRHNVIFTQEVITILCAHLNKLIHRALEGGVLPDHLQTVVANQFKVMRWRGHELTRSAEKRDVIAPFLTPAFLDVALRLKPRDRFRDAFHKAVMRRTSPDVLGVPFHSYRNTRQRLRNEVARNMIDAFGPLKTLYQRRKGPGRHARWEPWLRPILRERLLDHDRSSPVWELIDRVALEHTLNDAEAFRRDVYPTLYAATVVRFWDWYRALPDA